MTHNPVKELKEHQHYLFLLKANSIVYQVEIRKALDCAVHLIDEKIKALEMSN